MSCRSHFLHPQEQGIPCPTAGPSPVPGCHSSKLESAVLSESHKLSDVHRLRSLLYFKHKLWCPVPWAWILFTLSSDHQLPLSFGAVTTVP